LTIAAPASAHAEPTIMSPEACSTVSSLSDIRIDFGSELAIGGSSITAYSGGTMIATAGPDLTDLDRKSINVMVPDGVSGKVDVEWATRSADDGEEASGSYSLYVGGDVDSSDCGLSEGSSSASSSSTLFITGLLAASIIVMMALAKARHSAGVAS